MSALDQAADTANSSGDPDARQYIRKAISLLYGDNFERTVELFQQHQSEGFPDAAALAVVTVLDKLEADEGELPPEILAEVAKEILMALSEDLVSGGVIEDLQPEQIVEAVKEILVVWKQRHSDSVDDVGMARGFSQGADEIAAQEGVETPAEPPSQLDTAGGMTNA